MFDYVLVPQTSTAGIDKLGAACEAAMSAKNPVEAIGAFMTSLGQAYHAKRSYIYQLPPEGSEFLCTCEWCAPGIEPMTDVTHNLTMAMAARWFHDGNVRSILAIRDVKEVARVSPQYAALFGPRVMQTQILGKLMRGPHPLGTLGFDDPDPELFDELCQLMYPICAFAASTVNTLNLLRRMHSIGLVDELTKAGTRVGFYQKAEHLSPHLPVGMAYLDIAGLQGINDERGHDAGDALLIAVRQMLVSEFKDDQVFRMGGDEFLVMAHGMPEQPFRQAMKRIRERLNGLATYVAIGMHWQACLGTEYDALVRHVWLDCTNDKREWERRGGKRHGLDLTGPEFTSASDSTFNTQVGGRPGMTCYRNEEFFRHAKIWMGHISTRRVGLAAIDINYFKLYNDIYGREAGDLLLREYTSGVARLAVTNHGVGGYLGGDNFVVTFPVPEHLDEARLTTIIKQELASYDVAEGFAPAVGIVITDELDTSVTILYDRALLALQRVRGSYTQHIVFYDERRHERERKNQMMLIHAREGLSAQEFTFYLQPKVDIQTNKIVSAEALVRWIHDGEVVPPYKFIGLMEETGYIYALDRYVWEAVCVWQRALLDRGIKPVPVSVNVSRVDFYFTDLADHFASLVERYDLPTRLLGIEVTESAYAKDVDFVNDIIRRMQEQQFVVYMDDFGSGYSSLNMLRTVAVDVLKLDKGFIDQASTSDGPDAIISNVISMAHQMGLPVIFEGVETKDQRDSLRSMGCDYVQGYYYYRPMPINEFEQLLLGDANVDA